MTEYLRAETLRLATLARYAVLDTEAEPAFDALAAEAAEVFRVRHALVSFIDADRQWYKARFGVDAQFVARGVSFCTRAIEGDDVLIVPNAALDVRFASNPYVLGEPHIRFYAGAPIKALNRARLGTVCVWDPQPRGGVTPRERRLLAALAARTLELLEQRRGAARAAVPVAELA